MYIFEMRVLYLKYMYNACYDQLVMFVINKGLVRAEAPIPSH